MPTKLGKRRSAADASATKVAPPDGGQQEEVSYGDKSFTGGGNPDAISDGAARAPTAKPKRCLWGPECPYCTGDCTTCIAFMSLYLAGAGESEMGRLGNVGCGRDSE